jgi:selenocysteine lyase/cysteine desulfurase
MINITGQLLPVRKICDIAHERGVEVLVDCAHTFAHYTFAIPDLHCDYYGSRHHNWLSAPPGAGILYVKKEKIAKVWPLIASGIEDPSDIRRLNHIGTHPIHTDLAIADAMISIIMMGPDRKEASPKFLQHCWTRKVRHLPHVKLNTPADPDRSFGIGNVGVKGMETSELADTPFNTYRMIYTVPVDGTGVHRCRITPSGYASTDELDVLVGALKDLKLMHT